MGGASSCARSLLLTPTRLALLADLPLAGGGTPCLFPDLTTRACTHVRSDAHARRDAERDNHFAGKGFTVLRFWNNEIDRNLEDVLTLIPTQRWAVLHPASLRSATLPAEVGYIRLRPLTSDELG